MRKLLLFTIMFLSFQSAQAQYWEVGASAGVSSYIGDLQPTAPPIQSFLPSGGVFARYNYSPHLSFKGSATYGAFYASDHYATGYKVARNLEVRTTYYELAAMAELNLTKFDVADGHISAPYLFAGIAGFYFNPQARDYNTNIWTDLQPLGTEGQTLEGGKKYSRMQVAVPFGVGFRLSLTPRVNLGFEIGFRQTFTDYLDDVSGTYPDLDALAKQNPVAATFSYRTPTYTNQKLESPAGRKRGDSYKFDVYYFVGASLSVNLADKRQMEFNRSYRAFWGL